ncbi:TPA: hypothetical protein ACH3X1_009774 [Trebouxia sp. C0004]
MWKDPVQPFADAATLEQTRQHGQAANKLSLQHQLDLSCRKAISETMQQLKANKGIDQHQLAATAQSLNVARQAALAALKTSPQSNSQAECQRQRVVFMKVELKMTPFRCSAWSSLCWLEQTSASLVGLIASMQPMPQD